MISSAFILPSTSFCLDSGPGFGPLGRYTFNGRHPFLIIRAWGRRIEVLREGAVEQRIGDPFEALGEILEQYTNQAIQNDLPLQQGGMVGYLGYGLRQWIEQVPAVAPDDLKLPDLWFGCYHDIRSHTSEKESNLKSAMSGDPAFSEEEQVSNYSRQDYLAAVEKIKAYIASGDVYQVNLSQRLSYPLTEPPLDLYKRLCRFNPAPFAAYLDCDDFQVVSTSPERFLRYDPLSRRVETRPIKGTRPRGHTPEEDEKLAGILLSSEKDHAEHVMIVDLERNDLGRVCETGSVQVTELSKLEAHPTVWHLVSTVTGILRTDCDRIDLLKATFPSGSITGAPKIRAMEIIDELEPTARNVYTGAIGYLGFDGTMDLNIGIRTMVVKDGTVYVYVGGGIVADSDPADEYDETMDKARAMLWALKSRE